MPIGLTNAPKAFQHLMNDVFQEFLDDFVVYYLENILIYFKNLDEDELHVCRILQKLRDARLYTKIKK